MAKVRKSIYEVPVYWFTTTVGETSSGRTLQGISSGTLFEESYFGKIGAKIKARLSPAFWKNYNNLSPEERKKWHPFKFREGKIEKMLKCKQRYKNKQGDYICGIPTTEDLPDKNSLNGYFGGCFLHGYDNEELSFCPYNPKGKHYRTKELKIKIKTNKDKIKNLKKEIKALK